MPKINTFRAPNSRMTTASQLLSNAALINNTRTVGWERRQRVPAHITFEREKAAVKEEIQAHREKLASKRKILNPAPSRYLVIKRLTRNKVRGYQCIGFGSVDASGNPVPLFVATMEEVREVARKNNRTRIKLGAKEFKTL